MGARLRKPRGMAYTRNQFESYELEFEIDLSFGVIIIINVYQVRLISQLKAVVN